MNGELKTTSMRQEAWRLCKEFMGGPWKEVPLEEFRLFEVRGGFSNMLYRCALPENATNDPNSKHPHQVLLRIYGPLQADANVMISGLVTFVKLSERKLGPKLFGVFPKGRLEEFIPSRSLSSDELRKYSPSIAQEMAKIHALNLPLRKVPDFFEKSTRKWLSECKEAIFQDKDDQFWPFSDYEKEIVWCSERMKQTNSPVAYCHNDLLGGNVLYREDVTQNGKPNIMLIDFEFGAYNYRGFDIANHWLEWCFDYETPSYPHFQVDLNRFPSREEQIEFCTEYLIQLKSEGVALERPLQDEVENIIKDVYLFAAASSLFWSLWSIRMTITKTDFNHGSSARTSSTNSADKISSSSNSDGCHWRERMESTLKILHKEHSKTRKDLFQRFKKLHLESTSTD